MLKNHLGTECVVTKCDYKHCEHRFVDGERAYRLCIVNHGMEYVFCSHSCLVAHLVSEEMTNTHCYLEHFSPEVGNGALIRKKPRGRKAR